MNRRKFLTACALSVIYLVNSNKAFAATISKLILSDNEWSKKLPKEVYNILRNSGTEKPWSSKLNHEKRQGVYVCAGCGLELFTSEMKYNSGTGWPSFKSHITGSVETKLDFKLLIPRTEYHCARCGGHQGHVFKDGPKPTGKRWCNNGLALKFIPKKINES